MPNKGFFVDDIDVIYAKLLSTTGEQGLNLIHLAVGDPVELANKIFSGKPDIVAVDFRLDENLTLISSDKTYKGSVLAQLLRDKSVADFTNDFPIVLVTSEEKMRNIYRPDKTAHDLFDRVYTKERAISTNYKKIIRKELLALCDGYHTLRDVFTNNKDRLTIFSLPDEERSVVDHQELRTVICESSAPHHVAGFVLREIIDRNGILLSDNEVAARLGVSEVEADKFAQTLIDEDIIYKGIFHSGWRRWWAHRFDFWAETLFGSRPTHLTGIERVQLLKEKTGLDLKPARSTWFKRSSDERFAFACASCGKPAEVRHSLEAFDPRVPIFSQPRRICWDCIQTGKYEEMLLKVNDVDFDLIKRVKESRRDGKKDQ